MKQGANTIAIKVNSELELAVTFENCFNNAIAKLNEQGKRVINIVSSGSAQSVFGVIHIFTILWEIPEESNTKERTTKESKVEQYNTLTINSDNLDNLLDTVSKLIRSEDFEKAENYCSQILDYYPHHLRANILRLLIEYRVNSVEQLVDKESIETIASRPFFVEATNSESRDSCPEYLQIIALLNDKKEKLAKRLQEREKRNDQLKMQSYEEMKLFLAKDDKHADEALVDFTIVDVGENTEKIKYEIHYITGLRLFECAELMRNLPVTLLKDIPISKAETLKVRMEEAGGTVSIQKHNRV